MKNSFLSNDELRRIGFKRIGKNVLISRNANFYNPQVMEIGDNVRIDDFCILSGNIIIGKNVHISAGTYLYGGDVGIQFGDYSGISSRCAIYAISDDYSGDFLTNSTIGINKRNVIAKKVNIEKYVIIGTGSTILPEVNIAEGCAIGAMSLVKENTDPWGIYIGIPCKRIKDRNKRLLNLL